ncbi:MAG: ABC transporter substrate-binding protein, partial [Solirubrobacteraceae bacterium]
MRSYHAMPRMRIGLASLAAAALLALAGCGSSNSSSSSAAGGGGGATSSAAAGATSSSAGGSGSTAVSSCGTKPGVKASGSPINIGTIDTHQPGTDFTDGPNMINAYFQCVNDNGGVNGHPLKLFVQLDQTQPAQIAAAAKKLISSDHVVAIDGVFDLLECTIDQGYWKQLGIYEMDAGIAPECWSTPHSAAVNMGPRYSSDGAVQYALDVVKAKKIAFVQSN